MLYVSRYTDEPELVC